MHRWQKFACLLFQDDQTDDENNHDHKHDDHDHDHKYDDDDDNLYIVNVPLSTLANIPCLPPELNTCYFCHLNNHQSGGVFLFRGSVCGFLGVLGMPWHKNGIENNVMLKKTNSLVQCNLVTPPVCNKPPLTKVFVGHDPLCHHHNSASSRLYNSQMTIQVGFKVKPLFTFLWESLPLLSEEVKPLFSFPSSAKILNKMKQLRASNDEKDITFMWMRMKIRRNG